MLAKAWKRIALCVLKWLRRREQLPVSAHNAFSATFFPSGVKMRSRCYTAWVWWPPPIVGTAFGGGSIPRYRKAAVWGSLFRQQLLFKKPLKEKVFLGTDSERKKRTYQQVLYPQWSLVDWFHIHFQKLIWILFFEMIYKNMFLLYMSRNEVLSREATVKTNKGTAKRV